MGYNRYTPVYTKKANYNTNSPSYYDYLARVNEFLKMIGNRVEEYDEILAAKLKEISDRLDYYMEEWDKRLEQFPENVENLLIEWLENGTLDDIINENIFADLNTKIENIETNINSRVSVLTQEIDQVGTTKIIRN